MQLLSNFLMLFGFSTFLAPIIYSSGLINIGQNIEFPISASASADISPQGNIFISVDRWGRLQRYSSTGEFENGWKLNIRGGSFCVSASEHDVSVYIYRADEVAIFDHNGDLQDIRSWLPGELSQCKTTLEKNKVALTPRGTSIASSKLKNGNAFIDRHFWHYLFISPFLSIGLIFVSTIMTRFFV